MASDGSDDHGGGDSRTHHRQRKQKSSETRRRNEKEEDERASEPEMNRTRNATDDSTQSSDQDRRRRGSKGKRKHRKSRREAISDSEASSSEEEERRRKRKKKSRLKHKKRRRKRYSSSSSSSSDSEKDSDLGNNRKKQVNKKLVEKLSARGETLEDREARRAKRREARIAAKFGYTTEENPFNDPNLHETFTWKKKEETAEKPSRLSKQDHIFEEIEKVRQRRQDRELQFEEMERLRAEENRMKELENYDEWARKEEEFHLQQQRQRSAIRLVEGREHPIDVLAKNLLLFGLSDEEKINRSKVKYQERYNALQELETLEAELEEPHLFLKVLKLEELEALLVDIDAFRALEREASVQLAREPYEAANDKDNSVLKYWDALHVVTCDEIKYLKTGGAEGSHAQLVIDILKLFEKQPHSDLTKMKAEIEGKLRSSSSRGATYDPEGGIMDTRYWATVLEQLDVYIAKLELSDLHSKMLVRQLEHLEKRKEEIQASQAAKSDTEEKEKKGQASKEEKLLVPKNVAPDFGDLEEELGIGNEVDQAGRNYAWEDKYRPRKPRYFNRVKTGYDWNKYNQTHYDHDNPPPKIVQGYKFNIFFPDLINKHKTPQYFLEAADSDEFCILRFHAGPPYEDIAFKIINREWNRSRKRGFRSTFERGVLSLYFNFKTHWYRR